MVQRRSSSPQDHEGPDPDSRRSRPTVPMTRVNPVAKSSSSCPSYFVLLLLNCLHWILEFLLAPARLFRRLVLVRIFVRKALNHDESGSHPCRRQLTGRDGARDAAARCKKPPISRSPINRRRKRSTGHFGKADRLEIPYFQNELPTQPISFELTPPAGSTPRYFKRLARLSGGNRTRTPRTRRSLSYIPSQGPRSRILSQGPAPGPRPQDSNTVANTHRSKEPMDVTPCRPNAFDRFLKALNLRSKAARPESGMSFLSDRHPALSFCLSTISRANASRLSEGKPVHHPSGRGPRGMLFRIMLARLLRSGRRASADCARGAEAIRQRQGRPASLRRL